MPTMEGAVYWSIADGLCAAKNRDENGGLYCGLRGVLQGQNGHQNGSKIFGFGGFLDGYILRCLVKAKWI